MEPTFHDIPPHLWDEMIFPYISDFQYRFVGMVHRRLHDAYTSAFPEKRTYYSAVKREYAVICYQEQKGDLSTLQYLRELDESQGFLISEGSRQTRLPLDDGKTCAAAAAAGHLNVLQWCYDKGFPCPRTTCRNAARNGHIEVLEWCRDIDCLYDKDTCAGAVETKQGQVLEWCRENGYLWDDSIHVASWAKFGWES